MKQATHKITYRKDGGFDHTQMAFGKSDLFRCIREMMKDGYTDFTIKTIAKATGNTASE